MRRITGIFLALYAFLAAGAALAQGPASPEGIWELEFRDSHFRISYCGGDSLCAELIWLSEGASTPEKTIYLNRLILDHARPSGPNQWKGEVNLLGERAAGTIRLLNDNELSLTGCKFVVLCRTYMMYRLPPGASPAE